MKSFGNGITYYREKAGLTIEQLAKKAELSKTTVIKLEKNEANVQLGSIEAVAKVLNVSIDDLKSVPEFQLAPGFGSRIREFRKSKGLTQDELASRVGVSRQRLIEWEKEEGSPTRTEAEKICGALQLHFRLVFPDSSDDSPGFSSKEVALIIEQLLPKDALERELLKLWRQLDQKWKLRTLFFLTGDDFYFAELDKLLDKQNEAERQLHQVFGRLRSQIK